MPDSKVSALTAASEAGQTDLLYLVTGLPSSNTSKAISWQNLTRSPHYGRHYLIQETGGSDKGLIVESGADVLRLYSDASNQQFLSASGAFFLGHTATGSGTSGRVQADLTLTLKSFTANSSGGIVFDIGGVEKARLAGDTGRFSVAGAVTVGTTLGVTGATTLSSTLAVTGTSTLSGNVVVGSAGSATISCPGAGATAGEQFGVSAVASGSNTLAVGRSASATGNSCVALGPSASTGTSTNNIAIGLSASVNGGGSNSIVIGSAAAAASSSCVVIGANASSSSNSAVVVGLNATAGNDGVAIGPSATGGASAVAIGQGTNSGNSSIVIGKGATATATNQLIIGGSTSVTAAYIGNGVTNTSPASITFNATGGSGTDIAGASLTLAAGRPTGSGAGGSIIFQTAAAGSSGTTLRSLSEHGRVTSAGFWGFGTNGPQAKVHIHSGTATVPGSISSNTVLLLGNSATAGAGCNASLISGNTGNATILFGDTDAEGRGQIVYDNSTDALAFRAGGSATNKLHIDSSANVGLSQTSFGTSATRVFAISNGVAPSTSPADCFQIWSADRGGTAGKAGLHLRSEDGTTYALSDLFEITGLSSQRQVVHLLASDYGIERTASTTQLKIKSGGRIVFSTGTDGATEIARFDGVNGNLGLGSSTFGTSAVRVFAILNGVAPATSPTDVAQLYSMDQAAGNACLHTRTENGAVIKLYQETTSVTEATFVENSGGTAVNVDSTFGGYTLQQIAKALQNHGLLA